MESTILGLRALAFFTLLTGFAYPLLVLGIGQSLFSRQANGSRIEVDGKLVGSELIGQAMEGEGYFAARPSATVAGATGPNEYNAAASSGSNHGPLNPDYLKAVKERQAKWGAGTPVDLLTASGSGLDPHISPEAASWQAGRVAKARGVPLEQVQASIAKHSEGRQFGLLGEPRVKVLELNLDLDRMQRK
jgi:potassium-transporting ATPase KdpC subunit